MTTQSHSPPMPLIVGTAASQFKELGFNTDKIAAAIKESPFLRNIFSKAQAPAEDRFGGDLSNEGISRATAERLERLAVHMKYTSPDFFDEWKDDDNDSIPAGYTYLAQLAAHDIVHNVGPLPSLDEPTGHFARNYRAERLVLDTLYGGGPAAGCLPFALERTRTNQRWFLRLGNVSALEGVGPILDNQARDIARVRCPHLSDSRRLPDKGVPDALLADPRNDDHLILSQLTALFHEFHNIVTDEIQRMRRGDGGPLSEFANYRAFLEARKVVAFVYRRIISDDLLCRLLRPSVYNAYKAARYPDDFLDKNVGSVVPVEFSHAAYRFGHVMVRFFYDLNAFFTTGGEQEPAPIATILDRSSARRPSLMPVAFKWLIDWARFFDDLGARPNYSRRIRPHVGKGSLTDDTYFPNEQGRDGGIFYLDFARGADAGVRSVKSLVQTLRAANRELSPLLADAGYRENIIGRWLQCQGQKLTDTDLHYKFTSVDEIALSQDPPLLFFILFEAALEEKGKRLGTLGSTIVAEVFFAALKSNWSMIEGDKTTEEQANRIFGNNVPNTMPLLINFIKAKDGLRPVVP